MVLASATQAAAVIFSSLSPPLSSFTPLSLQSSAIWRCSAAELMVVIHRTNSLCQSSKFALNSLARQHNVASVHLITEMLSR